MKDQILEVLRKSGRGMRLREIGWELGVWHCSLVGDVCDLEKEGKITATHFHDIGNMERWTEYKIAEQAG